MSAGPSWKTTSTSSGGRFVQHGGRLVHMRNEAHNDFQVCLTAHAPLRTAFEVTPGGDSPCSGRPACPELEPTVKIATACAVTADTQLMPVHMKLLLVLGTNVTTAITIAITAMVASLGQSGINM